MVRLGYAVDASDRMLTVVLVAVVAYHLASGPLGRDAALWFVGAQAVLAYTTAGWSKLTSPRWRSGEALAGILTSQVFGRPLVGTMLRRHPRLARAVSWTVIAVECSAPVAVVGGARTTLLFVGLAAVLHLGIAWVMRLNHFVWAFAATYPGMLHLAATMDSVGGR